MTDHFAFAIIVLAYLAFPVVAYLAYWLWKKIRKGGADGDAEGEG